MSQAGKNGSGGGGGGGITTINGNSGSATGATVTLHGTAALSGSSITFIASGSTVTLNATDSHNSTYIGKQSGATAPTGIANVALGFQSLAGITSDPENVAIGADALNALGLSGATPGKNTAIGWQSLASLGLSTLGHSNTAVGWNTASMLDFNPNVGTAIGNTLIGARAGILYDTQESYNILLGYNVLGVETENNTMRLGADTGAEAIAQTFIAGIAGVSVANTQAVTIDTTTGQMGSRGLTILPNYSVVNATPYVVGATVYYMTVDTSTVAITIQLPDAPTQYRTFVIKDSAGNAAANNITVTTVSGILNIDAAPTFVMSTNYQSIQLVYSGFGYEIY